MTLREGTSGQRFIIRSVATDDYGTRPWDDGDGAALRAPRRPDGASGAFVPSGPSSGRRGFHRSRSDGMKFF